MGKKNLLNENTITRFMKLAAINENAAGAFINTISEDEEADLDMELADEEAELEDELADEEAELDAAVDDLEAESAEEGAEGAIRDMVGAVVDAIADVADDHGVEVALDMDSEEAAEEELVADEEAEEVAADLDADLGDEELEAELDVDAVEDIEDEDLALETRIRSIVAEMLAEEETATLNETGAEDTGASAGDESATHPGEEDYTTKKGMKKKTTSAGRGEKAGDEAYINESEDVVEESEEVEEVRNPNLNSHGRGQHEYNESVQIVDDGILVQEVTNKVFARLQKMINERKKAK